jgi:hypothetical protein
MARGISLVAFGNVRAIRPTCRRRALTNPGRVVRTEMRGLRKRYRVLLFAALVAALAVPVGFAWSLDPAPLAVHRRHPSTAAVASSAAVNVTSSVVLSAPAADQARRGARIPAVPDAAKLLLVGTILFGLAAFVRKAI